MYTNFDYEFPFDSLNEKQENVSTDKALVEEHITLLKEGAIDVFNSLLKKSRQKRPEKDDEDGQYHTRWQRIRKFFLNRDENSGETTQDPTSPTLAEKNTPILDLTQALYKVKLDLDNAEERKSTIAAQENNKLRDELGNVTKELSDMKYKYKKDLENFTSYTATIERQEKLLREKNAKIEELLRRDNVALWEKERTRMYETELKRVKSLEEERDSLKVANEALQDKLKVAEESVMIEKLRSKQGRGDRKEQTQIANQIYALEKDLIVIERELHSQTKYISGILSGIRVDIWTAFHKDINTDMYPSPGARRSSYTLQVPLQVKGNAEKSEESAKEEGLSAEQKKLLGLLWKRVYVCYDAVREGKLGQIRADLPDHYIAVDRNVKRIALKKLSAAYYKQTAMCGEKKDSKSPIANQPNTKTEVKSYQQTLTDAHGHGHPELVNPQTGYVNMITVMKHFPHMTKEYVTEQWVAYKEYDVNGDGALDLPEMMQAMNSTVGAKFTAAQVGETMLEIDVDGSQSVDFYEYICVANMLQQKTGKSEVFRSTLVQQNASSVSKLCVLQ